MDISFCHAWLSGSREYTSGLEFYIEHGSNDVIKNLLKRGSTKFNQEKLLSEIQSIANANPEVFVPGAVKKELKRSDLPEFLHSDFDKLKGLIQTISHLHSRLDLIQNDDERYNCAAEILNAVADRRMIFMRIDHYLQHGTDLVRKKHVRLSEVKILSDDKETRSLQLKQELILLRSQRSKLKNKPNRVEDYNAIIKRISEIETELA